jgi:glycosyltransferase involved in cell wall biosynthesis
MTYPLSEPTGTEPGSTLSPLRVTVAVCTWNRSASLAATLEQMTRLAIPDGITWELLVVNNASTDDTDAVVASFEGRLPLRPLHEPEPGLSNARNRALAEARGAYLLFTDDDCLVDSGWLVGYVTAIRQCPGAAVLGGPIEPSFEGDTPAWLPRVLDRVGAVYGRQTLGDAPVALTAERAGEGPYGGNMGFRREALLQVGGFDPALGVRHGRYAIGEETEVVRRVLAAGHEGWWTPEARVRHRIPRSAQTLAYVRRWMVGAGRYRALSYRRDGVSPPYQSPPWLLARVVRHEALFHLRRRVAAPEVWITDLIRASQARGQLAVSLRAATRQ